MCGAISLSPVSVPLGSEPQLHDIVVELTLKAMFPGVLPLSTYNFEGNVLHKVVNGAS